MSIATVIFVRLIVQGTMGFGWPNVIAAVGGGVTLYLPTLLQPFCQWKPFKITARFLLGVAVVGIVAGGLVLPPLDPLGFIARTAFVPAFWLVFKATLRQRARCTPDPCSRCGSAVYPFCEDNRPRVAVLLAELRRQAQTGDEAFVAFAAALAGEETAGVDVEVMPLRSFAAAEARRQGCHGGTGGQRSGTLRP